MEETKPAKAEPVVEETKPMKTERVVEEAVGAIHQDPPRVWHGPRIVQFNAGRIEISMPYQLGIALLLGLILICLIAFRLGQISQKRAADRPLRTEAGTATRREAVREGSATGTGGRASSGGVQGSYMIVLAQYARRADLEAVSQHFAEYGIATQIVQRGDKYLLVTRNTYDNPETPGTNGYLAKQKIVEVGVRYRGRAPQGYETFAPNFFKDAYGMKSR
jgi:hypothetical protein